MHSVLNDCETIEHLCQRVLEDLLHIVASLDAFAANGNHIKWQLHCHEISEQVKNLNLQWDRYPREEPQQGQDVLGLSDAVQLFLCLL